MDLYLDLLAMTQYLSLQRLIRKTPQFSLSYYKPGVLRTYSTLDPPLTLHHLNFLHSRMHFMQSLSLAQWF